MHTFPVSDVRPATDPLRAVSLAASFWLRNGKILVEGSGANQPSLVLGMRHPFIDAAHKAFARHYPLVLSPVDVWLCIAQGFGTHFNLNAEALRKRFVQHKGKTEIEIHRDEFVKGSPENDWPDCFAEFSDRIAKHVGKMRDLVVADFSTTGPVERAASEIVLMNTFHAYFEYTLSTLCGIPSITLLGSAEDWRSIRRRAEYLAEFGLTTWVSALLPVLDELIAAAAGKPSDRDFWKSFYKLNDGSGGPWVTGWINVFFPYIEMERPSSSDPSVMTRVSKPNSYVESWRTGFDAEWGGGPDTGNFPGGLSRVRFKWKYLRSEIPMELLGGFVGVSQDSETLAVRPAIGWAVRDTRTAPGPLEGAQELLESAFEEESRRTHRTRTTRGRGAHQQ